MLLSQIEAMRLILLLLWLLLLLLCCVAPVATFVAKVAPSAASKYRLGGHDDGMKNSSSAISGRRRLFPHALRARPDDGGRDDASGENATDIRAVDEKVVALEEDIQTVGVEISSVAKKIEAVQAALSGGPPYLGITDRDLLFYKEGQLRKEKEQLREKELLLLKKQPAAAVSLAGACELCVCKQPSNQVAHE